MRIPKMEGLAEDWEPPHFTDVATPATPRRGRSRSRSRLVILVAITVMVAAAGGVVYNGHRKAPAVKVAKVAAEKAAVRQRIKRLVRQAQMDPAQADAALLKIRKELRRLRAQQTNL